MLLDCRVVSRHLDGLSRYTLGLARALADQPSGFALTLLVPDPLPEDHPLADLVRSGRVLHVKSDAPFLSVRGVLGMRRVFARAPSDVYHYPHFNLPLASPHRSVVTVHDLTPLSSPSYFRSWRSAKRAYFRLAAASSVTRARAVIVPSFATARELERRFPRAAEKTHVVYEGVDASFREPPSDAELEECRRKYEIVLPFLLYVGVSRPHKNLSGLVRAFARIADETPHQLLLAGQPMGETDALDRLATELGVRGRIRRLGYVPEGELRCLYRLTDAFVLCSLAEGFGLGVVEAMASGAPVVVSGLGAAQEVSGGAAVEVDPASPESIAAGLREVCRSEARRDELRERGYRRAAEFTWQRAAEGTLAIYREVLAAP